MDSSGPVAKDLIEVAWENFLVERIDFAGAMMQSFGRYGGNNAYKDSGVGWLLLSRIDVLSLQKDNEKQKAINSLSMTALIY